MIVNKESRVKFFYIKKRIEKLTNFKLRPNYDPIMALAGSFVIDPFDLNRQFELYVREIKDGEESLLEAIEKEFGKEVAELIEELL